MSDTNTLSDIEIAKLKKTVLDICHLFIGDLLTDKQDERDKLWLETTIDSGIFESRAYWIRKELKSAYQIPDIELGHIARTLFYYNKEGHFAEFLTYLTIAYAMRNNSKDYAQKAREMLSYLDIEYGLIDKKLEYITIYDVIEKILTTPVIWDDGDKK